MEEYNLVTVFPSLPRTTRGSPVVLGSNASGDKIQFCNGTSVYTVPFDDPKNAEIYTEHSHPTTVAKTSPSGAYCASGDGNGNVRIWNTTNQMMKLAVSPFTGPVKDIAWCSESKRIAVVGGEGKDCSAHVFLLDTGTSCGSLTGQTRALNSVDMKPNRPFRVISGSDDNSVAIFAGPPFKFQNSSYEHTKFVYSTRFSPHGDFFVSAGGDGMIIMYTAIDGAKIGCFKDETLPGNVAHSGSIFSVSWNDESTKIASASADKTVKIWNAVTRKLEKTITFGEAIVDQQVGVIWTKKALVSVSAVGSLNFLNPENGSVLETRLGHSKAITALTISADRNALLSCDAEGRIIHWEIATGKSKQAYPDVHNAMITGMDVSDNGDLVTVSFDDHLKVTPEEPGSPPKRSWKLASQPLDVASSTDGTIIVAACHSHLSICSDGELTEVAIDYNSSCVALSSDKRLLVVGGDDSIMHVYEMAGTNLTQIKTVRHSAPITAISFSNNGEFLVATDQSRRVVPYSVNNSFEPLFSNSWTFHTAKVVSVAWSPDNTRIATGSVDTNLIVWDIRKPSEHPIIIKGAHAMSSVNAVLWFDETTVVSAGQDANIKFWNVPV